MTSRGLDILFVTRKWAPAMGGMETYSVKLTEQLGLHHQVEVVALPGRVNGLPPSVLALLRFPFTVMRTYLGRRSPPAIIHLGDMAIWPLGMCGWIRGGRVLLSAHGTDVSYPRRGGVRGRLYGAYLRLGALLLRSARVIANSAATAEAVRENGWRDIAIVPLATDMQGLPSDGGHDGTILFAGRLVRRKGCAWFIREVLPSLPDDVTLRVAGTAWDQEERASLESDRVDFIGALDPEALRQAYARAMCVVVPNIPMENGEFEGFGLVAAEAAAAGGVVLAAAHSGLREAVMDGVTGFSLPAANAEAWTGKIVEVRGWSPDDRKRFIDRSTSAAGEYFSWQRVARDTADAY